MSLRINHNIAAINANRNLEGTTNALAKSMQKLSSGFRINAAADDPAGLVISEQFRSQIAGLNRAIQNSEGSISMIATAEGSLTELNNLLVSMRELAIHAANEGFNDVDQLEADQAEITNAMATIDRIAANTQFGTKKILDGTKDNIATITSAGNSGLNIELSNMSTGIHSISATKSADATASLNTTSLGLSLANTDGDPINVTEGIHNIDVLQASDGAIKTSGAIDLADAWGNGLEIAAVGAVASMFSDAAIVTATAAHVGTYSITLNYQENNESPVGSQVLSFDIGVGDEANDIAAALQLAIDANSTLSGKVTVAGTAAASASLFITSTNAGAQYSVRVEGVTATVEDTQLFDFSAASARGASDNDIQMKVTTAKNAGGVTATATIGIATYTSMTALVATLNQNLSLAANFGTAEGVVEDIFVSQVGSTDVLRFETRDEGSDYSLQFITTGSGTDQAENVLNISMDSIAVTGIDAIVSFDNYSNRISSVKYFGTSDVDIYDSDSDNDYRASLTMTVGTALNGINLGNLLLDAKAARFNVRLDGGPGTQVIAGKDTQVWNASRTESVVVNYNLTAVGGTEDINNTDQSLVFQIGGNVGQTASIGIRNMSSTSLAKNVAGNMFNSLSEIDVTTVQGAQDAQSLIDDAINTVSTTRGTLGSFQKNTLESNLRNLRIASQNLTAAESMIRDTDMAVEMSEFTKNQILAQAGVSMLAQANQIPQMVLSLFR